MPQRSFAATLAAAVGITAIGVLALGIAGIHAGVLTPLVGFQLAGLGLLTGLVGLSISIVGFLRTRPRTGLTGRSRAWLGGALGLVAILAMLGGGAASNQGSAIIHDVTTDFDDPPLFSQAVRDAPDRLNGVDYPDGGAEVPEQQRAAYPDIESIDVAAPPPQVAARARSIAQELGWTVTQVDLDSGRIEAYDVTPIFKFTDDIVIRIKPAGEGSVVDLRSNSRVGGGDLGANAARIRAFRRLLEETE